VQRFQIKRWKQSAPQKNVFSKLFGASAHFLTIFSLSFIGCAVGLILLIVISNAVWEKWQNRRKKNGASKELSE